MPYVHSGSDQGWILKQKEEHGINFINLISMAAIDRNKWNERDVLFYFKVDWSCGTENAILTVSEPEKCEYLFTATTPALCLPLDGSSQGKKEEL